MKFLVIFRTVFIYAIISSWFFLVSCATIAAYDQYSYMQATSIKVDALKVVAMGTEDFTLHENDLTALKSEIQKIYEYDKNLPKNGLTTKQWEIVMDSSGHSMGGFLNRWKKDGKFSATYVNDKQKQISEDFDQIIQLEAAKIKSK